MKLDQLFHVLAEPTTGLHLADVEQPPTRPIHSADLIWTAIVAEQEGQRVSVGEGWSIELPRRFVVRTNPDGSWSGWDEAHVIDIQLLSTSGRADGSALAAHDMLGGKDPTDARWHRADSGLIARADLLEESDAGGMIYRLTTESAVANRLMSCWIAFRDIADLDWALERWRSIRYD